MEVSQKKENALEKRTSIILYIAYSFIYFFLYRCQIIFKIFSDAVFAFKGKLQQRITLPDKLDF